MTGSQPIAERAVGVSTTVSCITAGKCKYSGRKKKKRCTASDCRHLQANARTFSLHEPTFRLFYISSERDERKCGCGWWSFCCGTQNFLLFYFKTVNLWTAFLLVGGNRLTVFVFQVWRMETRAQRMQMYWCLMIKLLFSYKSWKVKLQVFYLSAENISKAIFSRGMSQNESKPYNSFCQFLFLGCLYSISSYRLRNWFIGTKMNHPPKKGKHIRISAESSQFKTWN